MAFEANFLSRLARDKRGNTIAIMAAALIPMLGLAGSAVDMTRLYVVKVRLQQACDAGVLAGRKFMTGNTNTLDQIAVDQANAFFNNNFQNGWMTTSGTTFTPTRTSNSQVSGTASTVVPMTIMKFFSFGSKPLTVTCQARYDVPDIDVMFVLDTTGSMACLPADSDATCSSYAGSATKNQIARPSSSNGVAGYAGANMYGTTEKSGSRIAALREAVLSFYDALDKAKDAQTKIRYGFVTYASSVNVGKAILDVVPNSLVGTGSGDTQTYQSRHVTNEYQISRTATPQKNSKDKVGCESSATTVRSPALNNGAYTFDQSSGTATYTTQEWNSSTNKCEDVIKVMGPVYTYESWPWPISGVVAGGVVPNPTKVRGQQMRWLGCVESKVESPGQSSFTTTSLPDELDPDVTPSKSILTGDNRWFPHLQDLEYMRSNRFYNSTSYTSNGDDWDYAEGYGSEPYAVDHSGKAADGDELQKLGAVACGKPVKRLGEMTRSDVYNFVYASDFVPMGGTYHDTGMIWGTRLISPTGPWAADTAAWSGHNPPNRVLVFLTDGDMSPTTSSYGMYGLEGYDKRVTGTTFGNNDPMSGRNGDGTCTNTSANCYKYTTFHNNRFLAECAAAKARNIDVWTVSIDTGVSAPLQTCATTTAQALATTDGKALGDIFANIAKKLAMLRIVQ